MQTVASRPTVRCSACRRRTAAAAASSRCDGAVRLCPRCVHADVRLEEPHLLLLVLSLHRLRFLTADQIALLTALAADPPDRAAARRLGKHAVPLRAAGLVESVGPSSRLTDLGRRLLELIPQAPS